MLPAYARLDLQVCFRSMCGELLLKPAVLLPQHMWQAPAHCSMFPPLHHAGSDGLWDNAYEREILELLPNNPEDAQVLKSLWSPCDCLVS